MIETSESITALTAGIIKVQGAISGVHKNAKNPHFKSSYATLENVIDTARPALQEAGIAFVQAPGLVVDGSVEVTTMLVHTSGEWMKSTLHVPLGKRDPQGVGSAITYGCRYSLMAMLGLPPTDDDGEAAMERDETSKRQVGWNASGTARTAHSLKKEKVWDEFQAELRECDTVPILNKFTMAWAGKIEADKWPESWKEVAREEIQKRKSAILNGASDDDTFPGDKPSRNAYVDAVGGM